MDIVVLTLWAFLRSARSITKVPFMGAIFTYKHSHICFCINTSFYLYCLSIDDCISDFPMSGTDNIAKRLPRNFHLFCCFFLV